MTLYPRNFLLILSAVLVFPACTPQSATESPMKPNTTSAKPAISVPSVDALLAQEKLAAEAYIKGDSSFFAGILSDKLVMQTGGSRLGKSGVIKMIASVQCEIEDGWALTEPHMLKIDEDTYVLSYKSTMDGSCTADGITNELPSPVRMASIWARSGEEWQVVFHGEIPIFDPTAPPATGENEKLKAADRPTVSAAVATAPVKPTSDPISDTLMATERSLWDAWMKHDADKINELMAGQVAFVNLFGTYFPDKAAALTDWTSDACKVTSFMLGNGVATSISPTVGILTLTGTVRGACGEQDISGQRIFATTVYLKDGNEWKWTYGFNSPK